MKIYSKTVPIVRVVKPVTIGTRSLQTGETLTPDELGVLVSEGEIPVATILEEKALVCATCGTVPVSAVLSTTIRIQHNSRGVECPLKNNLKGSVNIDLLKKRRSISALIGKELGFGNYRGRKLTLLESQLVNILAQEFALEGYEIEGITLTMRHWRVVIKRVILFFEETAGAGVKTKTKEQVRDEVEQIIEILF